MNVYIANNSDFDWLKENDYHVSHDWISRSISNKEYFICQYENKRIGFLRYSLFWGEIPYMDMVLVQEKYRLKSAGTALFNFWELHMKKEGAEILMTSSVLSEKEPQVWHKRNGFEESGQLTFGKLEPEPEIFFIKNI